MKVRTYFFGCLLSVLMWQCAPKENEYVVIAGKGVAEDTAWMKVAEALQNKHRAALLSYREDPAELLPQLQQIHPRYVAIVEKPETLGRDYVMEMHRLSRKVDNDIYADFLWGIITGYDAAGAMKMVNNSTEPLIIKDAVASIWELHSAKWFDRYGWVDDHTQGMWGEKKSAQDTVVTYQLPQVPTKMLSRNRKGGFDTVMMPRGNPVDEMQTFYNLYATYNPDLVVTAAHATERNLEMPFSLGNIKAKDGQLYMDFPNDPQNMKESGKRKVYFAVGNCLIGNVNNTKESMAIAWMNSGNAATMIGYVVTTWHGRNGWGGLKYWLTNPGRYSLAEAIYMNQQDLMYQLNEWDPKLVTLAYPYTEEEFQEAPRLIQETIGVEPTHDQIGFVHDRDVLAYYGDPKWNVRLQEIAEENDYTVNTSVQGNKCTVTIQTKENFSLERMKGDRFKQEHVLDLPFSYFFPQRLNNPRLSAGQDWKAAVDENFLLIYNADFKPGQTYTVELDID